MKKYLLLILCLSPLSAFAQMSFGDFLQGYFDTLLPVQHEVYSQVDVRYSDVSGEDPLYSTLQKAIYHDLFPNASIRLDPNRSATKNDLGILLGYHFGHRNISGSQHLDIAAFSQILAPISQSYAYQLISFQNIYLNEAIVPSEGYSITQVDNFAVLDDVYNELRLHHFGSSEVTDEELIHGAAKGMAHVFEDPYTEFLGISDTKVFDEEISGSFAGIGAFVGVDDAGHIMITGTIDHSPASKVGLRSGDIIYQVEETRIEAGASLLETVEMIKGPENTAVNIRILREGSSTPIRFSITRKRISIPFVSDRLLESGEYYIRIGMIGEGTGKEFWAAIDRMVASGSSEIILDVRGNPGGTLGETRILLDMLTPAPNRVIKIQSPNEKLYMYSFDDPLIDLDEYQMAVLIDGGTASAAEIITVSLEDYFPDTVHIVGEQSYGKGSAQQVIYMDDGSALKYTSAKWFSGKKEVGIDGVGITPEHTVPFDVDLAEQGIDLQLEAAKKVLNSQ